MKEELYKPRKSDGYVIIPRELKAHSELGEELRIAAEKGVIVICSVNETAYNAGKKFMGKLGARIIEKVDCKTHGLQVMYFDKTGKPYCRHCLDEVFDDVEDLDKTEMARKGKKE